MTISRQHTDCRRNRPDPANRVTREDYDPRNSTTADLVYRVFRFGTTLIGNPEHSTHGAQGSGPRKSTR